MGVVPRYYGKNVRFRYCLLKSMRAPTNGNTSAKIIDRPIRIQVENSNRILTYGSKLRRLNTNRIQIKHTIGITHQKNLERR
jgi:hypothetical protein